MSATVHLYVTVQPVGSKWAATLRRDEFGLTRPFATREQAVKWLLDVTGEELRDVDGVTLGGDAA